MTKHRHRPDIDDIAAAWVARCDRGPLSPCRQAELDAWLAADPRHLGAWARASAVFTHFDRARALGTRFDPQAFSGAQQPQAPANRSRRRFLWLTGTGLAAGLAGAAGVTLLQGRGRQYATRLGEILRVPLSDGSAITLNSASRIRVEFDHARRLVRLLAGEALFDVARDARRPFVVEAGAARVVAVGTSFTVERAARSLVKVMVREGVVEFASEPSAAKLHQVRLGADTLAVAAVSQPIEVKPLQPMEVTRRLAWRDGMLSFDGDTLAQAAAQFARYSRVRIVIDSPQVAARRVVGLYSATDPVGFARAVALSMNLHVRREGHVVYLEQPAVR